MLEAIAGVCALIILVILLYPRPKQEKPNVAKIYNGQRRGE